MLHLQVPAFREETSVSNPYVLDQSQSTGVSRILPMKANRNDSCPCGSGMKFKKCCEGKSAFASSSLAKRSGIIGAAAILVAAGAVAAWLNRPETTRPADAGVQSGFVAGSAPATSGPATQPPGPAPLGKVWSAEHGHWHDAPNTRTPTGMPNPIKVETSTAPLVPGSNVAPPLAFSQPAEPAPPGKVWSAAHGHWHDAPAGAMIDATQSVPQRRSMPQPPGPAPAGKVWSAEHGHWHDIQ